MNNVLRRADIGRRMAALGCCFFFSLPGFAAGGSPWSFRAEASTLYDNNISKSQAESDIEEDLFFSGSAQASYTKGFGFSQALTFTAEARVEEFQDFEGLSNTQAGGMVDYRFQSRSGFTAPTYSIFFRAMQADFETDNRDSNIFDLGFSATRRLTTLITGTLGVTATRRDADQGEVFNLERVRYFGNLDWLLSQRVAVYGTFSFIDGDVFSTATPTVPIINWAEAIEPDNAFGGVDNNKFVYRLDAETRILRLGINVALGHKSAIDISVDQLESDGAGPIEYNLTSVAASFFYRF